ncbi:hypothetical protein FS837_008270 [Tulasnella sp. UAMH 9824]|nr:hypothetical protein FS837_008270 [Tulasnella sp. UAMH 9824]
MTSTVETEDDASRAGSAPQARSSPVPIPLVKSNRILAKLLLLTLRAGHHFKRYLSQDYTYGMYTVITDCKQAMVNAQLFAGDLTNPAQPGGYTNVGVLPNIADPSSFTDVGFGWLVGTPPIPSGPAARRSPSSYMDDDDTWWIESNVWSLGANNELLLTWINSQGVVSPLEIAQQTNYVNAVYPTGSYATTLGYYSRYGYTESNFPKIRLYIADQPPSC